MENSVLEFEGAMKTTDQALESEIGELNDLQLVMIGGGCAEVCPY